MPTITKTFSVIREPGDDKVLCETCRGLPLILSPDGKEIRRCPDCYEGLREVCGCGVAHPVQKKHLCPFSKEKDRAFREAIDEKRWSLLAPVPWAEVADCVQFDGEHLYDSVEDAVDALDDGSEPWIPPRLVPVVHRDDIDVESLACMIDEHLKEDEMYVDWEMDSFTYSDLVVTLKDWVSKHSADFQRWEADDKRRVDLSGFPVRQRT